MPSSSRRIGHERVALIAGLTNTQDHLPAIIEAIAPQGRFALIDDPKVLDINPFKGKSVSVHWESMFTRSSFKTPDMIAQHRLLDDVSAMVDDGSIVTTMAAELAPINAANLRDAHGRIESGRTHRQDRARRVVSYSFAGTCADRPRPRRGRRPSSWRNSGSPSAA